MNTKKIFLALFLLNMSINCKAQEYTDKDTFVFKTISVDSKGNFVKADKLTDSVFMTMEGDIFPIYETENKRHYIIKRSKKGNREYKYYLQPINNK